MSSLGALIAAGRVIIALDAINETRYRLHMIAPFACRDTKALFKGKRVARFSNTAKVALRKLQQIHAATRLEFLRVPPNNRLELLKGDQAGQYSIRINDQWRVCFYFKDGHASDVEIVDYH